MKTIMHAEPADVQVQDERGTVRGAKVTIHRGEHVTAGYVIPPEGDCLECWVSGFSTAVEPDSEEIDALRELSSVTEPKTLTVGVDWYLYLYTGQGGPISRYVPAQSLDEALAEVERERGQWLDDGEDDADIDGSDNIEDALHSDGYSTTPVYRGDQWDLHAPAPALTYSVNHGPSVELNVPNVDAALEVIQARERARPIHVQVRNLEGMTLAVRTLE